MNTLKQINNASSHIRELLIQKMSPQTAFKIVSLAKEFDTHLLNIQEACKGKEISKEEFDNLLNTEIEIKNILYKSEITFEVSPQCIIVLEPFLKD